MTITPRSAFYNIGPIGIQTGMCESLTSYLMRLANLHDMSITDLMTKIRINELITNPSESRLHINGFFLMNGMDQSAIQWVSWLNSYTCRKDLDQLTLLPWKNLIFGHELIRSNQFFCEQCLHDQYNSKNVYIPLLWNIAPVKICHVHNIMLSDRCPFCKKNIHVLNFLGIPGYCPNCKIFLGDATSNQKKETSPYDQWVTRHFMQMIENNSHPNQITTNFNEKQVFPIFIPNRYSQSKHLRILSNKMYIKLPRIQFWFKGGLIPFEYFLRRGYFNNLSPFQTYDFSNEKILSRIEGVIHDYSNDPSEFLLQLHDLFSTSKRIIINSKDKNLPFIILQINPQELDRKCPECFEYIHDFYSSFQFSLQRECLLKLQSIQNTPLQYQSITQISKQCGFTRNSLRILAPEICQNILSTYNHSRKVGRERRFSNEIHDVNKIIDDLHYQGIELKISRVYKYLPKPGIFKNPLVLNAARNHINELLIQEFDSQGIKYE